MKTFTVGYFNLIVLCALLTLSMQSDARRAGWPGVLPQGPSQLFDFPQCLRSCRSTIRNQQRTDTQPGSRYDRLKAVIPVPVSVTSGATLIVSASPTQTQPWPAMQVTPRRYVLPVSSHDVSPNTSLGGADSLLGSSETSSGTNYKPNNPCKPVARRSLHYHKASQNPTAAALQGHVLGAESTVYSIMKALRAYGTNSARKWQYSKLNAKCASSLVPHS